MPLKSRILAGVAAVALAGGGAALGVPQAHAATQRCGGACSTLAAQKFGVKNVVNVASGSAVLAPFWFSPAEDFKAYPVGTVSTLYRAGLIAKSVAKAYGSDLVYEYESIPKGQGTVRCLGVAVNRPGTPVTLRACGQSAATLWIAAGALQSGNFLPLINAAASANSAMALTASSASGALSITPMSLSSKKVNGVATTTCAPTQMWELITGPFGNSAEAPIPASL